MRFLFIDPCFGDRRPYAPPLELAYIATYVRDNSRCEVEVVDPQAQNLSLETVLDKARASDFVGISCFTEWRFGCFELAAKIKALNPGCRIVVGGPHAHAFPEMILRRYPAVDAVVRGEGEETALELVRGKAWSDIRGLGYREAGGRIAINPDRPGRDDIDRFRIDYSLLPDMRTYAVDDEIPNDLRGAKYHYMLLGRGCKGACTFCGNSAFWKGVHRLPAPKLAVQEMKQLVQERGVEYFRFCDGLMGGNREWSLEFAAEIRRQRLDIRFRMDTRCDLGDDVFAALRLAGAYVISLGIESGSPKILKNINKEMSVESARHAIDLCRGLGYWVIGTLIVGTPGETREDFEQTRAIAKLVDIPTFYRQVIYPDTPLYAQLKLNGEISDEYWFDPQNAQVAVPAYNRENFPSAPFSAEQVDELADRIYYDYHDLFNPKRILRRYGVGRGLRILLRSFWGALLLRHDATAPLYYLLKGSILYRAFKRAQSVLRKV